MYEMNRIENIDVEKHFTISEYGCNRLADDSKTGEPIIRRAFLSPSLEIPVKTSKFSTCFDCMIHNKQPTELLVRYNHTPNVSPDKVKSQAM